MMLIYMIRVVLELCKLRTRLQLNVATRFEVDISNYPPLANSKGTASRAARAFIL